MTPIVLDIYHGDVVSSFEDVYNSGIRGVIHKASQGDSFKDKKYSARRPLAEKANLLWGAYHFGTGADVEDQVNNFLEAVGDASGVLLCLDYEPNPKGSSMNIDQAKKFLELVFKKTGQKPVLYSGHFIKETLPNKYKEFFGEHRLWLCQYSSKPVVPSAWGDYWLWQYTGDGVGPGPHSVDGVGPDVDLNVFDGDEKKLKKEWAENSSENVSETVTSDSHQNDDNDTSDSGDGHDDLPWMKIAKSLLGIEEEPGSGDNPVILGWAKKLGISDYNHDSIPWCALFVSYIVSEFGEDVTDAPLWALSWKNWGTKVDGSAYGAILVFKRQGGGHVGFYVSEDDDNYHVLGGNQGDMVCVKAVPKKNCVGIRWPTDHLDLLNKGAIEKDLDGSIISEDQMK